MLECSAVYEITGMLTEYVYRRTAGRSGLSHWAVPHLLTDPLICCTQCPTTTSFPQKIQRFALKLRSSHILNTSSHSTTMETACNFSRRSPFILPGLLLLELFCLLSLYTSCLIHKVGAVISVERGDNISNKLI